MKQELNDLKTPFPFNLAQQIVLSLYIEQLGRLPEPGAVDNWTNLVLEKGWTWGQITDAVTSSPEALLVQQKLDITWLYLSILGRAPDAAGLNAWTDAYHKGTLSITEIADGFLNSAEGKAIYPNSMSHTEATSKIYKNLSLNPSTSVQFSSSVGAVNPETSLVEVVKSLFNEYKADSAADKVADLEYKIYLNFLKATNEGDASYDAANTNFHLVDGGIYDLPPEPRNILGEISVGSRSKAYVGTNSDDDWKFNLSTWKWENNFDGKVGYDVIHFGNDYAGGVYKVNGRGLKSIDALSLDNNVRGGHDLGIILDQGFTTENNKPLTIFAISSNDRYYFTLAAPSESPFKPTSERYVYDVNAPGEWYLDSMMDTLTYFDVANSQVQEIRLPGHDLIKFTYHEGAIVFFNL